MPSLSFGLPDDAFWLGKYRSLSTTTEKAREIDFRGILLEGPARVDILKHQTLPLVGLRRATLKEAFYSRLETHAVITAIGVEDNRLEAALAWVDKSEEPEDFTPPKGGFQEGSSINSFDLEARDRLPGLPWVPGHWIFQLYLFDQESNPVNVRFEGPKGTEIRRKQGNPGMGLSARPVPDPSAGHSFEKTPQSPPLPEGEQIVILVDTGKVLTGAGKCIVSGSFRFPVPYGEGPETISIPGSPDIKGTTVVVPINLLALGEATTGPYLFPLLVPAKYTGKGKEIEGFFNVDLLRMTEPFGIPQRYSIRALHAQARSAPVVFSLSKPIQIK